MSNIPKISWRLLDTGFNDPYMNMAIDEAIVQSMRPNGIPVLRFFDWISPCISIGFSQRVNDVLDIPLCKKNGISFVRRPTGGGIVFHGADLTYSVVLPAGFVRDIYEGYILVQSGILAGIKSFGIEASLYDTIEKPDLLSHCFVTPNFGDIMVGNKKLCGLAARRIKQKILYQGYINIGNAKILEKYCKNKKFKKEKSISLEKYNIDKLKIKNSIISNWPFNLAKSSLTDEEEKLAGRLLEEKYSLDEWNYKR